MLRGDAPRCIAWENKSQGGDIIGYDIDHVYYNCPIKVLAFLQPHMPYMRTASSVVRMNKPYVDVNFSSSILFDFPIAVGLEVKRGSEQCKKLVAELQRIIPGRVFTVNQNIQQNTGSYTPTNRFYRLSKKASKAKNRQPFFSGSSQNLPTGNVFEALSSAGITHVDIYFYNGKVDFTNESSLQTAPYLDFLVHPQGLNSKKY
jgi:hypothetical protein